MRLALGVLLFMMSVPAFADDDATAIRVELEREAAAWNRGDLDGYLSGYERAASTTMVGAKDPLRGWDAIAAMYRKKYGDKARMGHLTFGDLDVRLFGGGFALVIGRWALAREQSAGGDVGGWFTLTLKKSAAGWRIIVDHTS